MPWPKAGARLIQAPGVNRTCRPSLVTLLTIFRPDRIVIGGAAGQYFGLFEGGLHRSLNRAARFTWKPTMCTAEPGNLPRAVGAAIMAPIKNDGPRRQILATLARDSRKNMGARHAGVRAATRRHSPLGHLTAR